MRSRLTHRRTDSPQSTQRHPDGTSRDFFYWSRSTKDAETRYFACELECLAVVEALERFRVNVDGTTVTLTTDCYALRWLSSFKDTTSRLFRWAMRLSSFTTSVVNGLKHVRIRGRNRILVPPSLIVDILHSHHNDRNHPGTIVSMRYWWPTVVKDVFDYVQSCYTCQTVKYPNSPTIGSCQPVEAPEEPNHIWAMDAVVIGTAASNPAAKYALCVTDHYSPFCWTFPTKTNTAEVAIASLSSLFNAVGTPRVLITDNGTNYVGKKTS